MIRDLAHVCFIVRDLNVSQEFYVKKLGLKSAFDFVDDNGERFGTYIKVGPRSFVEMFRGEADSKAPRQSFQHICLEVDDFHQTVAQIRKAGVAVDNVKMGGDNSWQGWLTDPDGNAIELHGYTPASWQAPFVQE
jgi:catechol 2,3-dioxygenase-like lactoylglutathione lyase family enzyme